MGKLEAQLPLIYKSGFTFLNGSGWLQPSDYRHSEKDALCKRSRYFTREKRCLTWASYNYAHFAVSADWIRLRTPADYEWIDKTFFVQSDGQCVANHVSYGTSLERSWSLIFGCSRFLCRGS